MYIRNLSPTKRDSLGFKPWFKPSTLHVHNSKDIVGFMDLLPSIAIVLLADLQVAFPAIQSEPPGLDAHEICCILEALEK
jgi:hypothetical protein